MVMKGRDHQSLSNYYVIYYLSGNAVVWNDYWYYSVNLDGKKDHNRSHVDLNELKRIIN